MATGLFGYFSFTIDPIGNLTGGYLNKHVPDLQPEIGNRITALHSSGDPFVGDFKTNWSDPDPKAATLVIILTGKVYKLSWTVSPTEKYEGTGIKNLAGGLDGFYEG